MVAAVDDADFIAERITEDEQSKAPAEAGTPVGAGTATQARSTERS
jgi:hypothetical protein